MLAMRALLALVAVLCFALPASAQTCGFGGLDFSSLNSYDIYGTDGSFGSNQVSSCYFAHAYPAKTQSLSPSPPLITALSLVLAVRTTTMWSVLAEPCQIPSAPLRPGGLHGVRAQVLLLPGAQRRNRGPPLVSHVLTQPDEPHTPPTHPRPRSRHHVRLRQRHAVGETSGLQLSVSRPASPAMAAPPTSPVNFLCAPLQTSVPRPSTVCRRLPQHVLVHCSRCTRALACPQTAPDQPPYRHRRSPRGDRLQLRVQRRGPSPAWLST